jgi:uncharacterized membrane protein
MMEQPVLLQIFILVFLFFMVGVVIAEKYMEWRHNRWTRKKR